MNIAYLGLGSNLGKPLENILSAIKALDENEKITILKLSSLYSSKPVDGSNQANFLNAVLKVRTDHTAEELLRFCQQVEKKHHKKLLFHWGPRTLDIDILDYANIIYSTECLKLPHPEISNRDFVIKPLLEIEPSLNLPILGKINQLPEPASNIISQTPMPKLMLSTYTCDT